MALSSITKLILLISLSFADLVTVELDPKFSLSWEFGESDITFTFNCTFDGWCGIGFNEAMVDTDMIIVLREKQVFQAWDAWSFTYEPPNQDSGIGCKNNVNLISSSFINNHILATVSRPLDTGDKKCDKKLAEGMVMDFCFAYLTENNMQSFDRHNMIGIGTLKLGSTQESSYYFPGTSGGGSGFNDDYETHGIEMTIMWLCCAHVGIMAARYLKWWKLSFFVHIIMGWTVVGFTMASVYHIFKKDELPYYTLSRETRYHSRIGLTLCALVISQALLGMVTKVWMSFKEDLSVLRVSRRAHAALGWAMCIPGLINLKYGWKLKDNDTKLHLVYAFYGILCAVYLLLEVRHRFSHLIEFCQCRIKERRINRKSVTNSEERELNQDLIQKIGSTHAEILEEIIRKRKDWVFMDEYVLDISGFMQNHPGGTSMLGKAIGEDVGKYINGCSSVGAGTSPYTHSQIARNLMNCLVIGSIMFNNDVLVKKDESAQYENMEWEIVRKYKVSESTWCIELKSAHFEVRETPKGCQWFGKHFRVQANVGKVLVTRYYSFSSVNLKKWSKDIQKAGYQVLASNYSEAPKPMKDTIRLHIKQYPGGLLSEHICTLMIGSMIHLKGLIGPGLGFAEMPAYKCIGFAAGTGVIPFFDLVHAIWRGLAPSGFSLHLYISFRSRKESFGLDLFEATQKKYSDIFNLHLNLDDDISGGRMTENGLKSWADVNSMSRAWTCGPSGFNSWIAEMLEGQGMSRSKIMIL